jgi:hypothetical protein
MSSAYCPICGVTKINPDGPCQACLEQELRRLFLSQPEQAKPVRRRLEDAIRKNPALCAQLAAHMAAFGYVRID